jgi:hypothetical protein
MQRENGRSQGSARDLQKSQQKEQEADDKSVEQNVKDMIPGAGIAKEPVLKPKSAMQKWIVLLCGSDLKPDPP